MLHQLPGVVAPHPPHILLNFFPLIPAYGPLEEDAAFLQLAADLCDFVKANPVVWEMEGPEPQQIATLSKSRSLPGLYEAVYESYAAQHGASLWCNKSMANLYYIPAIEASGIRPVYVHLVRDGRDAALSFRKAIVGDKHVYQLARQWRSDQKTAEAYCLEHAPERYIRISYEALIHSPEDTMKGLLCFLGLPYDARIFDYHRSSEARHTAEAGRMWGNVVRPVMSRNSNKFLSAFSEEELMIYESVAGSTLERYGYPLTSDRARLKNSFTDEEMAGFKKLNEQWKRQALAGLDPDGQQKKKAQEAVLERIRQRFAGGLNG